MKDKVEVTFELTDISKGLSVSDIQRATLRLFTTPISFPTNSPKVMTLEEVILESRENER